MSNKGKKLFHYCTECKCFVARKKNEPFKFPYKCKHDKKYWKRTYMEDL